MKYKRALLKLSGEAFAGKNNSFGIDIDIVTLFAKEIKKVIEQNIELAVVVGGGNYFRGAQLSHIGIDRSRADYMGMLGTVINALSLQALLESINIQTRVQTAITMGQVAEPYLPLRAVRHMSKGRVVIFAAGLGVPFFSTDSCAAQRALEINADVLLMGKQVDGVYSSDPKIDNNAIKFDNIKYNEVISRQLQFADMSAISLCMDNNIPIIVFDPSKTDNLSSVLKGYQLGTIIN